MSILHVQQQQKESTVSSHAMLALIKLFIWFLPSKRLCNVMSPQLYLPNCLDKGTALAVYAYDISLI